MNVIESVSESITDSLLDIGINVCSDSGNLGFGGLNFS